MRRALLAPAMVGVMVSAVGPEGTGPIRAAPGECSGVSAWVDYLHEVRDRQDILAQREADLSRDASLTSVVRICAPCVRATPASVGWRSYTETSGTITSHAARLLDQLLDTCRD